MIRLAAFADEADSALTGQIEALLRNGIGYIELRGIDGKNIAKITCAEAERYAEMLSAAGIAVWSVGSPIGKIRISKYGEEHKEKLRHLCRLAQIFGTDKMRIFSFYDAYDQREQVFSALAEMRDIAADFGIGLYHENEKAIYGDTLERVLDIMENVSGLHYVYDPANFLETGEDPELTLSALHAKTDYFHIKDIDRATHELVPAGYGDGRIDRLIAEIGDADDRVLTLEPHLAVFAGYAEIDGTEMKNKFQFRSNQEAFDAAVTALGRLLAQAGYQKVEGGYCK